jgi:hypothetical protein
MTKQITGTSCYITQDGEVLSRNKVVNKPKLTKTGYHEISLYFGKEIGRKWFRVHRLVAQYFIPNPKNKPFVNHIDGNKTNNRVENLEWVTHQENMEHAKNYGLIKRAEENSNSILTTPEVEIICKLLEQGYRNKEIADSSNATVFNVSAIRNGDSWTHISCKYKIPKRSRALSDVTITWICCKLQEGLTRGEILKLSTNQLITKTMIDDIRRRKIYCDISKDYIF